MTWLLIKLGIRFGVFGAVFGFAIWKNKKVVVQPKYAIPLVAAVFALINTGVYWIAKPVLNLATFGSLAFVMPFVLNTVFLYVTCRLIRPLKIDGILTMAWLALLLTAAHGALWIVLDKIVG